MLARLYLFNLPTLLDLSDSFFLKHLSLAGSNTKSQSRLIFSEGAVLLSIFFFSFFHSFIQSNLHLTHTETREQQPCPCHLEETHPVVE